MDFNRNLNGAFVDPCAKRPAEEVQHEERVCWDVVTRSKATKAAPNPDCCCGKESVERVKNIA
jgi:hypothetical protein